MTDKHAISDWRSLMIRVRERGVVREPIGTVG